MTSELKVSVIIPAYNAAKTIHEPLDSLLAQTHPHWEAIIVDDGSKDDTAVAMQPYLEKDDRFKLIQKENGGVCAARNTGLEQARYDWVLFLDSDDWIDPTHMEKMTAVLAAEPTLAAVYCGFTYVTPEGKNHFNYFEGITGDVFTTLARDCFFCIHALIISRAAMQEVGNFDPALTVCEDWDLWIRVARTGAKFGALDEYLAFYRMRPGSASDNGLQMLTDGLVVIDQIYTNDPRVANPHPDHKGGFKDKQHINLQKLNFTTWNAGLVMSGGGAALPLFDLLEGVEEPAMYPEFVAQSLFQAPLLSSCRKADYWPELWPRLEKPIWEYLQALEAHSKSERLAKRSIQRLAWIILDHLPDDVPISMGHVHRTVIDVMQPIETIEFPPEVDYFLANLEMDGQRIGQVDLPVCDGEVSAYVLSDAIAAQTFWAVLGRFFEQTVYKQLEKEQTPEGLTIKRNGVTLATGLDTAVLDNPTELHGHIGWTVFLQELWQLPNWEPSAFYEIKPEGIDDLHYDANGWITIEVGEQLFAYDPTHGVLSVVVKLAGLTIEHLHLHVKEDGVVFATEIRETVTRKLGLEMCLVAVREGILGQPFDTDETLAERLQVATARNQAQQMAENTLIIGRYPGGEAGTAVSRRAMFPIETAVTFQEAAKLTRLHLHQPNPDQPSKQILYAPERKNFSDVSGEIFYADDNWQDHFDQTFSNERDPWLYNSPYEQVKYKQTLSLLDGQIFDKVLEIGCAEGHFTSQLAPYAQNYLATDISQIAVDRTQQRCANYEQISYAKLDVRNGEINGRYDLIVCSELLYFMDTLTTLKLVALKLANALEVGGYLLTAHAHIYQDDPKKPGFTWEHNFGGKVIGETFAQTRGLRLVKEIITPLYRVQLFQKFAGLRWFQKGEPYRTKLDYQPTLLTSNLTDYVDWRGHYPHLKSPVFTSKLPILMYHRVSPTGGKGLQRYRVTPEAFEGQLDYLRRNGYYTISLEMWAEAVKAKRPLPGRPIILTFDDGYQDFYDYAFPLLKQYNYTAINFIVAGLVGQTNEWDAAYGDEAPLMSWEEIQTLHEQGITIGAHTYSHAPQTALSTNEIIDSNLRTRAILESKLQAPVNSFAYPYGGNNKVVQHLIGATGYSFAVTTEHFHAQFDDSLLALPRLEITFDDTVESFQEKLENKKE